MPLWDATPEHDSRPVLVVQTPGFAREAVLPLVESLRADGDDVHVISFGCGADDASAVSAAIGEAAASLGPDVVIVAHGIGATLALQAPVDVAGWVLLAPVLDVWPTEALRFASALPVGAAVDLRGASPWEGRDLRAVLLGEPVPALGCAPVPLVAQVQGWVRDGHVPLDLASVDEPVWIGISLGDDLAAVEAVVKASDALPQRTLVRLGLNRFDAHDFGHGAMLTDRVPVRLATKAVRHLRP